MLAEFKPPVVSFHFGLPAPELVAQVKGWGGKVLSTATTLPEARWLQKHGADAVIAQGLEAGGHRGHFLSDDLSLQAGTMALVPQLVSALEVPVIAAGGIADARGVAAAMALGASGVQVGTAYLLCPEASTRAVHKAALRSDSAQHTALTTLFSGRPARGIVNRLMDELGPLNSAAPAFPLAGGALAPLRAASEALGRGDFSPLWAGQHARCRELPAGEADARAGSGLLAVGPSPPALRATPLSPRKRVERGICVFVRPSSVVRRAKRWRVGRKHKSPSPRACAGRGGARRAGVREPLNRP